MPDLEYLKGVYENLDHAYGKNGVVQKGALSSGFDDFATKMQDSSYARGVYENLDYAYGKNGKVEKGALTSDFSGFYNKVKKAPLLTSLEQQSPNIGIQPVGTYESKPVSHELPQTNGDIQSLPQVDQPKGSQKIEQSLGVRNEAIKNTARIKFKNLGIDADENSLPFKKEVSDLHAKHDNGETVVTVKNGKPILGRALNGWDSYLKGLRDNKAQSEEAIKLMDAPDNEAIKILDGKAKEQQEYLPPTPTGLSGFLGNTMGGMTRMIKNQGLGAMAGEVAAGALAPETGGASLAFIPLLTGAAATIPEFRRLAYSNELQKRYSQLIQEGKSKEDAYKLAKQSAEGAGLAGAGEALAFSMAGQAASKFIPAAASSLKGATGAIKGLVKRIAPEALGQAAVSASSAVAKDLYAKHLGIDVTGDEIKHDALDNASEALKTFGLMGMLHASANGLMHLPGYVKSQIKNALTTVPPEQIQQVYGEMEQKGLVPEGSSQKPLEELDRFAAAKQKIPTGYSEEQLGSLSGLVELKNKLKEEHLDELQKTDPSFHTDLQQNYDAKISAIDQQIDKIKKADNPLEHEVDDATGDVAANKPAIIMPDEVNKPHTEITNEQPKENLLKSENNQPEYKPTINDAPFVDRHFSEEEKAAYDKLDEAGKEKMIDDKRSELKNKKDVPLYDQTKSNDDPITVQRLHPEEEQGRNRSGSLNVEATAIIQRVRGAIEKTFGSLKTRAAKQEYNQKSEQYLEDYAKQTGQWVDNPETAFGKEMARGQEQKVYHKDGDNFVTKINDLSLHENIQDFLDRIALHATHLPSTSYELIGFGKNAEGKFVAITKQPLIKGDIPTQNEIVDYMKNRGYKLQEEFDPEIKDSSEAGKNFVNDDVLVEDLHRGNVIKGENGEMFVIDPDIKLNTRDKGFGGRRKINNDEPNQKLAGTATEPIPTNEIKPEEQADTGAVPTSDEATGQGDADSTPTILDETTTENPTANKQGDIQATDKVEPDKKVSEDSQATEGGKDGVRISKAGLAQEQGFSKEFDSRGGGEVANSVLDNLKSAADREGIPLNKHIENQVNAMKGKINDPNEHNIITAGSHLLNIDKQIKEAIASGRDIKDLQLERDQTAAVLRQLGNTTGRNLGLFNLVFKDVSDSGIEVAKNSIKQRTGIQGEVPESMDELRESKLTTEDKKKVEPYVKKIEEYKKEQAKYEANSAKKLQENDDKALLKAIKEAHEAGKKEGLAQAKDKPAKEKKSQQLKDLAKQLRTSDEMDKFLKGSGGTIEKAGLDLGSYKEIVANVLEGVAKAVEAGENVSEFIKNAIEKVKDVDKRKLLEDVQMLMSRAALPTKESSIEEINKIAENEKAKTITKSMVDKGLIKNVVDHVIHSDVPYDKVIDEATKELQQHLPNVTKENVADAFTRRNEFALESKGKLENTIKEKKQSVVRLTVKEGQLKALENAEDYHAESDTKKKQQLKSDYEKEVDEKISNLKKEKADAEKKLKEPPTHEDRINEAKDAVNKRIEAIRKEISDKQRKLEKDKISLHEDEELRRLKEVEKSLGDLRDKYLPKEPKKFADEKELKRRRVALNKEISDLNDQINSGQRKSGAAKLEDTEHIKQLKKIRDEKKELLDKVAPDYEKLKKQQDAKDELLKKRLGEIQKEIDHVNNEKSVYQQAIKDPVKANEQLKAARELRDKTYAENGLRVEKNARSPIKVEQEYQRVLSEIEGNDKLTDSEKKDKIAELKAQRDADLSGTKQGVISHLHDDISGFQEELTNRANDAEVGSKELKDANDLKSKLENIRKGLSPTGEHLEDVSNKAHNKITDLLNDKSLSKEDKAKLNEIKSEFEKNNQLTSDELANKRIKKQLEKDIQNNERKIKSGIYTEMPTTAYDFRRSDELTILHNNRDITAKKFNLLAAHANEKNKTLADKIMDASSKLLVSGIETVGKVAEAGSFKPVMDTIVEYSTGQIIGGLTGAPTTTLKAIKHGLKTYGAFTTKAAAEAHINKLADIKEAAITKLEEAKKTGDSKQIEKAENEFKKADLNYGISTLYRGIDANSLTTFWQYIAHGATDFDEQIGKAMKKDISEYRTKLEKTGYVLEGWVRSHGALKTSLSARNAVMRSFASTLQHFQKEGLPLDENRLALAHIIAVNDYEAGKLSNKTALSKTISQWKSSDNTTGRLAAKFAFAVSTIAINIAKRGVDYSSLGVEGLAKMAHGTSEGMKLNKTEGKTYDTWMERVADGYMQIPLQERLYINGVISRGMFGAGLGMVTLVGLANGNIKYGGTYEDRKKRKIMGSDGQPLKPDEWEFNGWRAPKLVNAFINHVPEMLPIALSADAYNIHELDKEGAQKDENYALSTIREIVARLPFQTIAGIFSSDKPIQSTVDRVTRIPAAKNLEGWMDPKERENSTIGERIKNNTGLGFLNPEKGGKFTKSTPAGKFIQESNLTIPAIHQDNYKYPGGVDASHPNGKANKNESEQIKEQHDNLFEQALNTAIESDYFNGMTYKEKQEELNAMSAKAAAIAKENIFKDVEPNEVEKEKKQEKSQKRKDFYERAFPQ